MNYVIKNASLNDMSYLIDMAGKEGWNPGIHDGELYYLTDPNGFFIGYLNDKPVSCISAVNYNDQFGFIGFYIVDPEFRGKSLGIKIWNHGMHYLKHVTIALDGVVDQQENYKKSGFTLAFQNSRYQRKGLGLSNEPEKLHNLQTIDQTGNEAFLDYDEKFFVTPRRTFMAKWLNQADSKAIGSINPSTSEVNGLGLLRKCQSGYKIGPLVADSPTIAHHIMECLLHAVPVSEDVFLDVPGNNPNAIALANRFEMSSVFETARMYNNAAPTLPKDRIFGITSFEIG